MKTQFVGIVGALVLAASACTGASHESERTGSNSAATLTGSSGPGALPAPCPGTQAWGGSAADLLAGDAIAVCSATADNGAYATMAAYNDKYLNSVIGWMTQTANPGTLDVSAAWVNYRNGTNGCNAQTGSTHDSAGLKPVTVPQAIAPNTPLDAAADADLRSAGFNLCVAQELRKRMPGAAGNEALFFSEAEQRELLEVIRERAQVAMLQYALIGEIVALPPFVGAGQPPGVYNENDRVPRLQQWVTDNPARLAPMGNDFGAAVQLHGMASEELASLLARDRSARTGRSGPAPQTLGDEYWGSGSWYQRGMALLFGGDPLAVAPAANGQTVAATIDSMPGTFTSLDWATEEKVPYVVTDLLEPQPRQLLTKAQFYDVADVRLVPNAGACNSVDATATANGIYADTETKLRIATCYKPAVPGQCQTAVAPPIAQFSDYLLWQNFRISPDHATTLALYLADALVPRAAGACNVDVTDMLGGALDIASSSSGAGTASLSFVTDGTGTKIHIGKKATLAAHSIAQVAGAFTRNAPFRLPVPEEIDPSTEIGGYGFNGSCVFHPGVDTYWTCSAQTGFQAEAKRTMGAISAQASVREAVLASLSFADRNAQRVKDYFAHATDIVGAIGGHVGNVTVSVVPQIETFQMSNRVGTRFFPNGGETRVLGKNMRVTVTYDPSTGSGARLAACAPGACTLFAIQGQYAASLAAHPDALYQTVNNGTVTGTTSLTSLIGAARSAGRFADARIVAPPVQGLPTRAIFEPIPLGGDGAYTFVVAVGSDSVGTGSTQYYLLAGDTLIHVADPLAGQYVGGEGSLGTWAAHQTLINAANPTEPAYDGFDLPIHWVPPFSAELLGGSAQQSSSERYLAIASQSADDASKAVETAIQGLVQQQLDQAELEKAVALASLSLKQERDGLCGTGNVACNLTTTHTKIQAAWFPDTSFDPWGCTNGPWCTLGQSVYDLAQLFYKMEITVASPVLSHISDPQVPSFNQYAGGSLQLAFIEQWRAIHAVGEKLHALRAAEDAGIKQMMSFKATFDYANKSYADSCGPEAFAAAEEEGHSSSDGASVGLPPSIGASMGESDTRAPTIALMQHCNLLQDGLPAAEAQKAASLSEAMASIVSATQGVVDMAAAIQKSSAAVSQLVAQRDMADARTKLDVALTASTQLSSLSIYRRYRDFDMWRARALLESARRYAIAARRAIEARYVVDLTRLGGKEAFVAGPSGWADQAYGYDLSLPASVGLVVASPEQSKSDGIYANKVKDYVRNLEGFVTGYSVTRPAAIAQSEINVMTLPGFQPGTPVVLPGQQGTIYPDAAKWEIHCKGDSDAKWTFIDIGNGDVMASCPGSTPNAVRMNFTLDPWGRLNGFISNEPFTKRFNARWDRLAVNIVGTGVKDCRKAADPNGCYSQEYVPYNLTHFGPSWVTDYDEMWRQLLTPIGQIEGGKALAAEIWLDPLRDGWSTSYIAPVARTELELRPLGGAYQLLLNVPPELVLPRIERVQILLGSSSWVKQQ